MAKRKRPQTQPTAPQAQSEALDRFHALLDDESFTTLLAELERPLYPALRVNPLKPAPDDVHRWAERYGWSITAVPYCPTGWWVTASQTPVSQTIEHRMGRYYIQDAASMLPVELFDLNPIDRPLILDMAASPGGKTTHLVSRTFDHGLVVANDSGLDRTTALRLVLQTWGAANVAATRFPGEKFGRWFPDTFDRVLLDAPCSMQSLRSTESHPMRVISSREQTALARRQTNLLASALAAVKIGGQVVYSTCTLAPEEDEGVLDELLSRFPGAFQVEDLGERLQAAAPALAGAYGHAFHPEVQHAARLWPHIFHTSGFFAARLSKTAPISMGVEPPPSRPLRSVGQEPLTKDLARLFIRDFAARYGFNLDEVLAEQRLQLWHAPNAIYAVPLAWLEHFADLPCQLLGLKVAERTPQEWTLSHEWVARFGDRFQDSRFSITDEFVDAWLRGEDISLPSGVGIASGTVAVIFDPIGRCLGRGRVRDGLLKNLLPHRLV